MQRAICVALFSLFAFAPKAHAAEAAAVEAAAPQSTFSVGVGAGYLPEYAGADDSRFFAMLSLDYAHKSGFFASTRRGIGFQSATGPLRTSVAISYERGRKEHSRRFGSGSPDLRGMGDIAGSTVAKLGIGYDLGFMTFGTEAKFALSNRERGNTYELAVGVPLLKTATNQVTLFGSADYADRKQMQTYYGVTAAQSARSGYNTYNPSRGFEKVALGVNWNHQINSAWSVRTMAGVLHMVGDAKDSPLTKRRTSPMLLTTVNYAF